MRKVRFVIVSIVALAVFGFQSGASVQHKQYQSIGLDCNSGSVDVIFRKDADALWIGHKDMVSRLTDEGFKTYYPLAGTVKQILQDSQDNLWVLSDSALCRFTSLSATFERFDIAPTAAIALEDRCLFAAAGTIYSCTGSKMSEAASYSDLGDFNVTDIFKWTGDSVLLIDRANGAILFDYASGSVTKCAFIPKGLCSVFVDSRQRIWLGKPGEGLTCLSVSGTEVARYTSSGTELPGNTVKFIDESNGSIVVMTDAGLCRVQPDQGGEIVAEKYVAGDSSALPSTEVTSMFCAADGSTWFGRSRGGVFVDRQVQAETFRTEACNFESISCIYGLDSQKKVWLGTFGSGVMTYDSSEASTHNAIAVLPQTAGLTVNSIANYSGSELVMACAGRGFMLLDKNTGAVRHLETGNPVLDSFGRDGSAVTFEVSDGPQGSVMMMSGAGMYRYDPATRAYAEVNLPESVTAKTGLNAAFPGKTGLYYWNPNSLYEYDVMSNSLVELTRFKDFTVTSASVSEEGDVWLASDAGLICLSLATRKYETILLPCGCAPETVLCSSEGRVWIGTSGSLCVYDSQARRFTGIDVSDGVISNVYSDKAKYYSVADGDVYVGGLKGFSRIDAGMALPAPVDPEIVLVKLDSGDETVSKAFGGRFTGAYPIDIEVSPREDNLFRTRRYKFTVDGPGRYHYDVISMSPSLKLSGLPHGRFNIAACCSLKNGEWSQSADVASFTIRTPWYKSLGVFIVLFLLLVAAAVYYVLNYMKTRTQGTKQTYQNQSSFERLNFLVNLSHELRTPLTLTMGPLEKVLGGLAPTDTNYKRLKSALKQTKKMKTLLDTVLTASKVQSNGIGGNLNLTYQSFNNWVKHVVADFKEEADGRNINLQLEFGPKIGMLDFDEEKCQVVLSNILLNAFAHNPDDSEIQVWTELHPERAAVRVSVSDRGTGIKEEDMAEIFNRFYQSTEENHGYGIGLAYSKQIMDMMHGVIGAYNNSHGGSTFYFEIPTTLAEQAEQVPLEPAVAPVEPTREIVPEKPATPAAIRTEPQPAGNFVDPAAFRFEEPRNVPDPVIDLKNATLLIVEDDVALRTYLQDELSESLNKVLVAGNGIEAIKVLNSEQVNVIVSDVMMPEMDGFTLCRYVKTTVSVSHIPVILLTARSDEHSRMLGYKNGADDYITKPFDLDVLKDSIQRLFFSRESMRQRFTSPNSPMPSAEETTFSSADEVFLQKFAKLVQDNISDPDLDSKFLVDNMGMSRTVLFNKVKQLTGLNIQNYVNKVRMDHVIHLMNTTNLSLGEIAEKSGFSSPRYFSTSFKTYTGVTPSQYKKDHR